MSPAPRRLAPLAAFPAILALVGCTARPAEPRLTAPQIELNLQSFDQVWTSVRDKHWDPALGGLDWNRVRDELRPQVAQAVTMTQARAVLRDAVGRLDASHFGIIPAAVYSDIDETPAEPAADSAGSAPRTPQRPGAPPFDVQVVDDRAVVTRVHDPPATPGVRQGWIVQSVDGESISSTLRRLDRESIPPAFRDYYRDVAVRRRLAGPPGSTRRVEFLDHNDRRVSRTVTLAEPRGQPVHAGNLPTVYVRFEARRLDDGPLLIRFNQFFDPVRVMQGFEDALRANPDAPGVIIDLRGNTGGLGAMAMGLAGWFISQPGTRLGTMTLRDTRLDFVVTPRAKTFDGPLAILVDGGSMSTSEIFAGGLQDLRRARIFGTPTPGAALPSIFEKLPNGDRFQYAFADYVSTGGQRLEGRGVHPDQVVRPTRAEWLAGRDPVVEAARRWIAAAVPRQSSH